MIYAIRNAGGVLLCAVEDRSLALAKAAEIEADNTGTECHVKPEKYDDLPADERAEVDAYLDLSRQYDTCSE